MTAAEREEELTLAVEGRRPFKLMDGEATLGRARPRSSRAVSATGRWNQKKRSSSSLLEPETKPNTDDFSSAREQGRERLNPSDSDGGGRVSGGPKETVVFISDVHSNLEALQSVLARVGDLPIFCLGDIVGYGASPNQVVDLLREKNAVCIMGNHDNAAVTGDVRRFNSRAAVAAAWTSRNLSEENRGFLASLPRERNLRLGESKIYMTHGSPDDHLWEYVHPDSHYGVFDRYLEMLAVDVIALGHTHIPFVWSEGGRTIFNPGSVGQPRDGDSRASYALLTAEGPGVSVEHGAVEYDVDAAARKILDAELPSHLADRLFSGS